MTIGSSELYMLILSIFRWQSGWKMTYIVLDITLSLITSLIDKTL